MSQPLALLPVGQEILIDANVLVHGLSHASGECAEFLRRCMRSEISGFTTVQVLGETCHRLMLAEAEEKGEIRRANAGSLQGRPHVIRGLSMYWEMIQSLPRLNIAVLPLDEFRFQRAHALRRNHGLMTTDSLVAAACDVFGIPNLASQDTDFGAVPWISVFAAEDI